MNESILIAMAMIFAIALIIAVFALIARNQAKKNKDILLTHLHETARLHQLQVGDIELFRNRAFAMDRLKMHVVAVQKAGETFDSYIVDLQSVDRCEVIKIGTRLTETAKSGKKLIEEHIREIQLRLSHKDDVIAALTFYNEIEDGNTVMVTNREKADMWKQDLSSMLKNSKPVK